MIRNNGKWALALGAVLAASGAVRADGDTMQLSGGAKVAGTTMTLGGTGSAAQAAAEDNELTGGYRYGYGGYYGGYRGGYYGGYRGGYYGGYRGGYYGGFGYGYRGGYYGGYRGGYYPRSYVSFNYYRPAYYGGYYNNFYSYPAYSGYYGAGYGCGTSLYLGISGSAAADAPTVTLGGNLGTSFASQSPQAVAPGDGTFHYDGGPASPVPLPRVNLKDDPRPIAPAAPSATDVNISLKSKPAASPYRYKAYGEQ